MIAFITSRPLELLAQYFNDDGHKYRARHVIVTREFWGNNLSFPKTLVIVLVNSEGYDQLSFDCFPFHQCGKLHNVLEEFHL